MRIFGASDETWTRTSLTHAPQTCLSAYSSTLAFIYAPILPRLIIIPKTERLVNTFILSFFIILRDKDKKHLRRLCRAVSARQRRCILKYGAFANFFRAEEFFAFCLRENFGKVKALHHITAHSVKKFYLLGGFHSFAENFRSGVMHKGYNIRKHGLSARGGTGGDKPAVYLYKIYLIIV